MRNPASLEIHPRVQGKGSASYRARDAAEVQGIDIRFLSQLTNKPARFIGGLSLLSTRYDFISHCSARTGVYLQEELPSKILPLGRRELCH